CCVIAGSVCAFVWQLFISLRSGAPAGDDPWQANTLEWATSSPPPPYNFDHLPELRSEPPILEPLPPPPERRLGRAALRPPPCPADRALGADDDGHRQPGADTGPAQPGRELLA